MVTLKRIICKYCGSGSRGTVLVRYRGLHFNNLLKLRLRKNIFKKIISLIPWFKKSAATHRKSFCFNN